MAYENIPKQLFEAINPIDVRAYATKSGWKRTANFGKTVVFTHPDSELTQLLVPLDARLSDYARRMSELVFNLAESEGRPAQQVLNDLLMAGSDLFRFAIDGPQSHNGTIPFEQGINLLAGVSPGASEPATYGRFRTSHPLRVVVAVNLISLDGFRFGSSVVFFGKRYSLFHPGGAVSQSSVFCTA